MLIKPLVKQKLNVKSLPSNTSYPPEYHPAYFGTKEENIEFLESEGRLLMLTLMYHEWNLIANKRIHDTNAKCERMWAICECQFASKIREDDIRRIL